MKKQFIDNEGVTENMSPKEKFEFLQNLGYIKKSEIFENWTFKIYNSEGNLNENRK